MTEAIYKVGDILEFTEVVPRQFGSRTCPVRGLVIKISNPGHEYLFYRLLVSGPMDDTNDMMIYVVTEKDILPAAKRIGHVDISALMFMENDEPDYAMLFTAATIAQAANLKNENEKLKAENKALSDTLSKSEAKAQSRLNRNEVLKKENEEVRSYNKELEQALSKSEEKAHSRLDEIASLMRKVDELESANNDLKTELGEKAKENERLSNAQRYLDLSNENRDLKAMNDELRKSIPEYNRLVLEYYACTEKIKKLENENARYFQSMTCVEKQLNEATKRINAAMEHLDVACCDN